MLTSETKKKHKEEKVREAVRRQAKFQKTKKIHNTKSTYTRLGILAFRPSFQKTTQILRKTQKFIQNSVGGGIDLT